MELSGRVLENWVAKTSNMLIEELDATAGSTIAVDMPPHWKSFVWALASWQVGAVTVLDGDAAVDVRLTMEAAPETPPAGNENELLVLVAPGALDMRWAGTLPDGAVDYAATVRAFGDVYLEDPADSKAELMRAGDTSYTFSGVMNSAYMRQADMGQADMGSAAMNQADRSQADMGQPDRSQPDRSQANESNPGIWLVPASLPLLTSLPAAVRIWAGGGTVVLVHPAVEVTDRLLQGERVTARLTA